VKDCSELLHNVQHSQTALHSISAHLNILESSFPSSSFVTKFSRDLLSNCHKIDTSLKTMNDTLIWHIPLSSESSTTQNPPISSSSLNLPANLSPLLLTTSSANLLASVGGGVAEFLHTVLPSSPVLSGAFSSNKSRSLDGPTEEDQDNSGFEEFMERVSEIKNRLSQANIPFLSKMMGHCIPLLDVVQMSNISLDSISLEIQHLSSLPNTVLPPPLPSSSPIASSWRNILWKTSQQKHFLSLEILELLDLVLKLRKRENDLSEGLLQPTIEKSNQFKIFLNSCLEKDNS